MSSPDTGASAVTVAGGSRGLGQGARRPLAVTALTSLVILLANAVGGVVVARALSPDGRGAVATIVAWAQVMAWACALGFPAAVTYTQSRDPELGRTNVTTSFVALAMLGAGGLVATQLLVLVVFANQPDEIQAFAHLFGFAVFLFLANDIVIALLGGNQTFGSLNLARAALPVSYVALVLAVAVAGALTVGSALLCTAGSLVIAIALGLRSVLKRSGIGRPSAELLRSNLRYGIRLYGSSLAGIVNYRLDFLIMPIFLAAAPIGLYSVAANVSSVVVAMLGSLQLVVFPLAVSRGPEGGLLLITRCLRLALALGLAAAAALWVLAPWLIPLVYGDEFGPSVPALRILLIGAVMWAGSNIVTGGLKAVNRPLGATIAQIPAVVVTVVGLFLVLERWGIEGAAVVSAAAYALSLLVGLAILAREPQFSPRQLVSLRGLLAEFSGVVQRVSSRGVR